MEFGCTSCGLCCRMIGVVIANANEENTDKIRLAAIRSFPHEINEDGSCSKLVNDRCSVYKNRPILCNVNTMHRLTSNNMSQVDYYNLSAAVCNKLMDENNSKKPRVKWIRQ